MNALPANQLPYVKKIYRGDGEWEMGNGFASDDSPDYWRFDDDLFRRDFVCDKSTLHELGYDDKLPESRHRTLPAFLREHAVERRLPVAAERRTEDARPESAGPRAVALQRSVGV